MSKRAKIIRLLILTINIVLLILLKRFIDRGTASLLLSAVIIFGSAALAHHFK